MIPESIEASQRRNRRGFVAAALIAAIVALVLSLTVALITVSIGIARAEASAALLHGIGGARAAASPPS
jgi:hypothetical protein